MANTPTSQNRWIALLGIFLVGFGLGRATDSLWVFVVIVGLVLYVNGKTWRP